MRGSLGGNAIWSAHVALALGQGLPSEHIRRSSCYLDIQDGVSHDTNLCAIHAKRVTIMPEDIQLESEVNVLKRRLTKGIQAIEIS
ncbi:hypothetical protein MKW92_029258 [Papaver armeniacum]|nr:hypothetical protein MKW92_029258 [Papaver armeniacum]